MAVVALGRIGPPAKAAVPALVAALKDPESLVHEAAAEALGSIGPEARQAIPALQQAARQWEPRDSFMGLRVDHPALVPAGALVRIDPQAAVPLLDLLIAEATRDQPSSAAIRILGQWGRWRSGPSLRWCRFPARRRTLRQIKINEMQRSWSGSHDDLTRRASTELEGIQSTLPMPCGRSTRRHSEGRRTIRRGCKSCFVARRACKT